MEEPNSVDVTNQRYTFTDAEKVAILKRQKAVVDLVNTIIEIHDLPGDWDFDVEDGLMKGLRRCR